MRTFLLRLSEQLHARLKDEARLAGLSMQEYCLEKLQDVPSGVENEWAQLLSGARELFGDSLIGVVLFGSFARGEATPRSDVDLMVVVERSVPLTRELYRRWDSAVQSFNGRALDAHFAYLPEAPVGGGVWAEAAIEGRVIADRDLRIHRALVAIRGDIADGRLRRQAVHGQSYWTSAA